MSDAALLERLGVETHFRRPEIERWLGRGAHARVGALAHEGGRCALKIGPKDELAHEWQLLSSLANIDALPRPIAYFEAEALGAIAMECIDGEPWIEHVRGTLLAARQATLRKNLPMAFGYVMNDLGENSYRACGREGEARLRALLPSLCTAVQGMHDEGIVHGDLQPSNLLARGERTRVLDLGLGAPIGSAVERAGTAAYLAPEHGHASAQHRAESDWYSLGVVLFEALTGSLPFSGGGAEVLVRKQSMSAPAPIELCPEIAPDLNALTERWLARQPEARGGHASLALLDP